MTEPSVQLYSVREALNSSFDRTLAELVGFGFTQVEPFQFIKFAEELRTGLAEHGLSAPTGHVGLLSGDQEAIFTLAVELGMGTVIDPFVDPERWQREEDVIQIAAELNAACPASG